jgi:hypothetical protein
MRTPALLDQRRRPAANGDRRAVRADLDPLPP